MDRFGKEPTGILEKKKMKLEKSPEEIRIAAIGRRPWEHADGHERADEHLVRSQEERTLQFF